MRFAGDSGGPYSSHASSWTPYWMCLEADAPAGADSTNANTQTTTATRMLMSPPIRRTPYAYPPRPRLDACMLGRRKNSVGADPHAHVREPRRLRHDARRLAGAGSRSGLEPGSLRFRRLPAKPRRGADGANDVRARNRSRPLALAGPRRLRARLAPPGGNARSRRRRQRPGAAAAASARTEQRR